MKTKIIAAACAVLTILSLTACQATPEKEVVVQKDTERLIEQVQNDESGEKLEAFELPEENYTWSATGAEGNLTINVDAKVTTPEGKLPTAHVSAAGFEQATVTKLFNYLFPNEKPLYTALEQIVQTKSEIEDQIIYIKKMIAEGTLEEGSVMTEEEALERIAELEEELPNAPETEPEPERRESDGTMFPDKVGAIDGESGQIEWEEKIIALDASTDNADIRVTSPVSLDQRYEAVFMYSTDDSWEANYITSIATLTETESSLPIEAQGKLNISYSDAKTFCDDFFAAGDLDMQLGRAYVVCDGQIDGESGVLTGAEHYAYEFYYVRTVNGAQAANVGDLTIGGYAGGVAVPWTYETAQIRVNDNGIIHIWWVSPTATGEVLAEDTGLMSFEEITKIFETMIMAEYEPQAQVGDRIDLKALSMEINIDEIELGLVRIRTQNADGREGIYTPAWVFYGTKIENETYTDGRTHISYDDFDFDTGKSNVMLVINAVDGSIIDLVNGY